MLCEACGAPLPFNDTERYIVCEFCGTRYKNGDYSGGNPIDMYGATLIDGKSPNIAKRFSYEMDDYGPCNGPITDDLLFRALHYVQNSESNFFSLTEKATGRFLQTPGHSYIEASMNNGKLYGKYFDSIYDVSEVFLSFLLIGQFPDISSWEIVDF